MDLCEDSGKIKNAPRMVCSVISIWKVSNMILRNTSITVLSNCQSFPAVGSASLGAPGLGLKVPGSVHFGYSRRSRAHSFRLTSKISRISRRAERTAYPAGVFGSGEI